MTATTVSGKVTRAAGNLFLAVGLLLLGATLAYYGYGFYQQVQSGLQVPGFGLPSLLPRDPPPVMPSPSQSTATWAPSSHSASLSPTKSSASSSGRRLRR